MAKRVTFRKHREEGFDYRVSFMARRDGVDVARIARLRDRGGWYFYNVGDSPRVNTCTTPADTLDDAKAQVRAWAKTAFEPPTTGSEP